MIKAIFNIDKNLQHLTTDFTYTIMGHANHGKYGHDIVCAAVSALTASISNELIESVPEEIREVDFTDGFVRVKLKLPNELILMDTFKVNYSIKLFSMLLGNMKQLSNEYPLNVSFQSDVKINLDELIQDE